MIRASLVDDEANVRAAAAQAFDVLQERLGFPPCWKLYANQGRDLGQHYKH